MDFPVTLLTHRNLFPIELREKTGKAFYVLLGHFPNVPDVMHCHPEVFEADATRLSQLGPRSHSFIHSNEIDSRAICESLSIGRPIRIPVEHDGSL